MIALLCAGTELGINRPQFCVSRNVNNGFKRVSSQSHLGIFNRIFKNSLEPSSDRHLNGQMGSRSNSICLDENLGTDPNLVVTAANTTLISGSLSQGVQNALCTGAEFFFGANELNLFGMDGSDTNNNNTALMSGSRQSLAAYSDLSKLKDEAFDFRSFRRGKTESAEEDDEEDDDLEEGEGHEFFSDGEQISTASSFHAMALTEELEINYGENASIFWDPLPRLKAILEHYSKMGDVQMCAAVCLVIGDKIIDPKIVRLEQVELWFYNYLDLLERLQLWNAAAVLIKTCFRPNIQHLSIWSSCGECSHGGHLEHMQQWFNRYKDCPYIGCGHKCKQLFSYKRKR